MLGITKYEVDFKAFYPYFNISILPKKNYFLSTSLKFIPHTSQKDHLITRQTFSFHRSSLLREMTCLLTVVDACLTFLCIN